MAQALRTADHTHDVIVPQNWDRYTAEDHETWSRLYARQIALLPGRIDQRFLDGLAMLEIDQDRIPDYRTLSAKLKRETGFEVVAVPGLVDDDVFFSLLAERKFPAAYWIRRPDQFDYIEEPDLFHDVFGHVPLLVNPDYADFVAAYGAKGLEIAGSPRLKHLARLYWYTIEFGLLDTAEGLRIFGAGIASSPSETVFALESASPNRVRFDAERVMRTEYRIDDFQETYFVARSFTDLVEALEGDTNARIAHAAALGHCAPGAVLPEDKVITVGDGSYHRAKRRAR